MNYPNYHTHTHFCDGTSFAEEYIKTALKAGMPALGFSGHAPVPFSSKWNMSPDNYRLYQKEILQLKEKYKGQIEVFSGLEVDYIPDIIGPNDYRVDQPDYIIGAIHYLRLEEFKLTWDFVSNARRFEEGYEKYFNNNPQKLVHSYFNQMNEMIEKQPPDIIAHIDQINKFNWGHHYFHEESDFYLAAIDETLDLVKEKGCIVEINTRIAYRGLAHDFNPAFHILMKMRMLDIPIVFSSDAHKPDQVDLDLSSAAESALAAGYTEHFVHDGKGFAPVALNPKESIID